MEVLGNGQGLGGFPHRLKNLKNRNGHYSYRQVIEYEELAKSQVMAVRNQSWNFTHFAPKIVSLWVTLRNLASVGKVCIFLPFLKNVVNAKFGQRNGNWNQETVIEQSSKSHGSLWEPCRGSLKLVFFFMNSRAIKVFNLEIYGLKL